MAVPLTYFSLTLPLLPHWNQWMYPRMRIKKYIHIQQNLTKLKEKSIIKVGNLNAVLSVIEEQLENEQE